MPWFMVFHLFSIAFFIRFEIVQLKGKSASPIPSVHKHKIDVVSLAWNHCSSMNSWHNTTRTEHFVHLKMIKLPLWHLSHISNHCMLSKNSFYQSYQIILPFFDNQSSPFTKLITFDSGFQILRILLNLIAGLTSQSCSLELLSSLRRM